MAGDPTQTPEAGAPPETPSAEIPPFRLPAAEVADPRSAMATEFNRIVARFARRYFRWFDLDPETVAKLRALEEQGSVVYVMRYASRLDYFLFNWLFIREGLRLCAFANGLSFYYYRPIKVGIRGWWQRRRMGREARLAADRERAAQKTREVVDSGESMFLFLRTARLRGWWMGRQAALEQSRQERDLLAEVVRSAWDGERQVAVVPLALFWRKGPRAERRFLNLGYGAQNRPSDVTKVASFLASYRGLAVRAGDPIDLTRFIAGRREEGEATIVRKVRRSLLLFLYREERAVEGPVLRPLHRVQESVLEHPSVRAAIQRRAHDKKGSIEAARAEAERMFREIAANMNSTLLAFLRGIVTALFGRLFAGIETRGLGKVAEYAKRHPVVLLPSHRSYFDFLILSWLFYQNHLVPPHIAARENMGFGPFGFIFRRAGAYFLRKSFDDPLYKEVFRRYVGYLVAEGFTQEFFIEGGRSRTGKMLPPRLGMVSWVVDAFVASGRRDLFFVPVAITYERLVEEGSMVEELEGGAKKDESMLGLVRSRSVLTRRFGSVFLNFGEPISLADALEGNRDAFRTDTEATEPVRREFTERLGNSVVERINWAMAASATSVAAAALLGEDRRGMFRSELVERMGEVTELLKLQDVHLTPALEADEGEFTESIPFLLRSGLIQTREDARGEIVFFEESRRRALEVYRNGIFHFLAAPSIIARRLARGTSERELREDLAFWLDLLYAEFFVPRAMVMAVHLDAFIDYFERIGALERADGDLRATEKGQRYFRFLAAQTRSLLEAYYAATQALQELPEPTSARALEKAAEAQFESANLIGEIQRREGWNTTTFRNALDLLLRRGILTIEDETAREKLYTRGEAFGELSGLRERLGAALAE